MNTKDFLKQIDENIANVLCIDFDGVIHNHNLGFYDGTIYGDPIEGSLKALKQLSKKYRLIIYTCKANPDRPLINGKTGEELIWDWLDKYGVKENVTSVTYTKPNAVAYIDDKAVRFMDWEQTLQDLNSLSKHD